MCGQLKVGLIGGGNGRSVRRGNAKQYPVPADITDRPGGALECLRHHIRQPAQLFVLILASKQDRRSHGIAARAFCCVPDALSEYLARISADVQLGFSGQSGDNDSIWAGSPTRRSFETRLGPSRLGSRRGPSSPGRAWNAMRQILPALPAHRAPHPVSPRGWTILRIVVVRLVMGPLKEADRSLTRPPMARRSRRGLPQPSLRMPPPSGQPRHRAVPCHGRRAAFRATYALPVGKIDAATYDARVASALDGASTVLGRFPISKERD
jgi:hypothetical protein